MQTGLREQNTHTHTHTHTSKSNPITPLLTAGNQLYVEGQMEGVPVKMEEWTINLSLNLCGKVPLTGKVVCNDDIPGISGVCVSVCVCVRERESVCVCVCVCVCV